MRDVADLLNRMRAAGVITDYALFGAVAQMRYTEPVATLDADGRVAVAETDRADVLSPLYRFCEEQGYRAEGEAIRVGAWPVQFIPASMPSRERRWSRRRRPTSRVLPFGLCEPTISP